MGQDTGRAQRFESYAHSRNCAVESALEVIGGKWKGVILFHLLDGAMRFSEIRRAVGSITQRTLTKQLRELEADGVLTRTVYPVVPPHVEYCLTEKGYALRTVLVTLRDWGRSYTLQGREAGTSQD
ncbi:winged helix-turn-helix transcriptional regulator [Martelella alba]|nr:helix-turn-helix domain-containing protein [Martelella alba]